MRRILILTLTLSVSLTAASSQSRKTRLLPDAIIAALGQEISGAAAKDTVAELSKYHRVQASSGFAAAADFIAARCRQYGLSDVAIEHYPADGKTTYGTLKSVPGWEAESAVLEELAAHRVKLADLAEKKVALADYSTPADVTAELVDVGAGTSAKDYELKTVKDRIVLAGGPVAAVHAMAVDQRGAAGIVSYQPNQVTGWSGDFPDNVRWGHLSPYNPNNKFAFMISLRKARALQARLGRGDHITVHASVRAGFRPSTLDVVTATIPGTDLAGEEIVFSCHLCHQEPGANDNASGSAAILEVARALRALIGSGRISRPRRSIRFLWPPEINGTMCYLSKHPDEIAKMKAVIHLDMVGGSFSVTRSILHLTRTPASLPSAVSDVAEVFGEYAIEGSKRAAMDGDFTDALLAAGGNKNPLVADVTPYEMGSDHDVYQEGSFRVPAIYLRDWPDIFIHTDQDMPSNIEPTKLKRSTFIAAASGYFLAQAGADDARTLAEIAFEHGVEAIAASARRAARSINIAAPQSRFEAANIIGLECLYRQKAVQWAATLAPADEQLQKTIPGLCEALSSLAESFKSRTGAGATPPARADAAGGIVYARNPNITGPMDVYYYNYVDDHVQPADLEVFRKIPPPANAGLVTYETLNLVDGNRSAAEIRNVISGAYGIAAPQDFVEGYLALLEKAGVVTRVR